jgi:hypothetical protein
MTSRVLIRLYISLAKSAGGMFLFWASALTRRRNASLECAPSRSRRSKACSDRHGNRGEAADADDAGAGGKGDKASPRRVDGVDCRRVYGWCAMHAISLGHWISVLYGSG